MSPARSSVAVAGDSLPPARRRRVLRPALVRVVVALVAGVVVGLAAPDAGQELRALSRIDGYRESAPSPTLPGVRR